MVYHVVLIRNGKKYNYVVYNYRDNGSWKKKKKYIGVGSLSKGNIKIEIKKFEESLKKKKYHYLTEKQVREIRDIKQRFSNYLKKAGKSGVENFKEWFFTELTYNSNAIEGNTLNLRQTSLILNENIVPKNSTLREVYEVKNHKDAINFLENYKGPVNEGLILKVHSLILKNIDNEDDGRYRKVKVHIRGGNVEFPNQKLVPRLVKDLINWYKKNKNKLHPFELAMIFSMRLVSTHPFTDGNGRVSRLIMNLILKKFNYPEINIYFKQRNNYLNAVRKANNEDYNMINDFLFKILKKNYNFLYKE